MAPVTDTFNIVMQKGIEGGFAPPTPHARYILTRSPNSDVFVVSAETRPHGTPELLPAQTRELKVKDHAASISRLQELLCNLPTQYPGAQDLYGRNTSIVHDTEPSAVGVLGMSGSQAGFGIPYPTEEQKAAFDEAVAIIESLGMSGSRGR